MEAVIFFGKLLAGGFLLLFSRQKPQYGGFFVLLFALFYSIFVAPYYKITAFFIILICMYVDCIGYNEVTRSIEKRTGRISASVFIGLVQTLPIGLLYSDYYLMFSGVVFSVLSMKHFNMLNMHPFYDLCMRSFFLGIFIVFMTLNVKMEVITWIL